ncbi:hypothetical protein Kpol_1033p21 [Vanderwaltozyma polyspora DSM 70294]|uniref:Anaphase-promoting complex subunit 9 n=1 Tax=Vanderwaltozyma polyspora (strain ATCC 22028 / DSM 70294 / BCRC 21397 / CBS 2163 / NBRC 10782 / NRRL Y-8283 / UCD 57-17) TaxID=436907 RepID=A7TJ18_VANPO|nr:uncharacterized protein Kpol_1033p21 [Vanderwaltozyma polyspora DSM 70294]EDO17717.1 hypothetical protein Kpol_1033p21 [Vanderwaltozyma polyspora DSM 70294]
MNNNNNNHNNNNNNTDNDQSNSFQLPSLPPWKSPRFKTKREIHLTTPLRRPTRVYPENNGDSRRISLSGPQFEISNVLMARGQSKDKLEELHKFGLSEEYDEYDCYSLTNKTLVRESKIQNFLQSERAVHCLVFHKDAHINQMDSYRPDINYNCGDGDELDSKEVREDSSLLINVPGYTNEELTEQISRGQFIERPNIRRIDEILNHEVNDLTKFWNNSTLAHSFERNTLHEQYLILQREQKELAKIKESMRRDSRNYNKNLKFSFNFEQSTHF